MSNLILDHIVHPAFSLGVLLLLRVMVWSVLSTPRWSCVSSHFLSLFFSLRCDCPSLSDQPTFVNRSLCVYLCSCLHVACFPHAFVRVFTVLLCFFYVWDTCFSLSLICSLVSCIDLCPDSHRVRICVLFIHKYIHRRTFTPPTSAFESKTQEDIP